MKFLSTVTQLILSLAFVAVQCWWCESAHAQPTSTDIRPKIGLVLGGGGARGAAHLGVLEVLDQLRVPVDCVAGTSMGAIFAGAFVAGVQTSEMKAVIGKTDWTGLFDDSGGRQALDIRHKEFDDRFYPNLEFGVSSEGLSYREGAVSGQKIKLLFNELVRSNLGELNIEDMALPLALLATDIGTGERVAIRSGKLTSAMRASMSIPGVIAPVKIDGRKLVDGGLVDNVPVQEVRALCGATVVIAVNVGSPLMRPNEVVGVFRVVGQMVNLLTEQNVTRSLATLGPKDIYIRPDLGDISSADFERQTEAIEIDRQAALALKDQLQALSLTKEDYEKWRANTWHEIQKVSPTVDEIEITNIESFKAKSLLAAIRLKPGEKLDTTILNEDLINFNSRGNMQLIDYSVVGVNDRTVLRIQPVDKSTGPDSLRFGFNLATDFDTDAQFNVRSLYRRTWINGLGGEWLLGGQIGSSQALYTELYQPLDYRNSLFIKPFASIQQERIGLYSDGHRKNEYRVSDVKTGIDIGMNFGGIATVGWLERETSVDLNTGSDTSVVGKGHLVGLTAQLKFDNQDHAYIPTRGYKGGIEYFSSMQSNRASYKYERWHGSTQVAWTLGEFLLWGAAEGGHVAGETPPLLDAFVLGGPGRLSAYAPSQIAGGDGYWLTRLDLQYRITNKALIISEPVRVGFSYELAQMFNPLTERLLSGQLNSSSIYLATKTALGPFAFGYAWTNDRRGRIFMFIGVP